LNEWIIFYFYSLKLALNHDEELANNNPNERLERLPFEYAHLKITLALHSKIRIVIAVSGIKALEFPSI